MESERILVILYFYLRLVAKEKVFWLFGRGPQLYSNSPLKNSKEPFSRKRTAKIIPTSTLEKSASTSEYTPPKKCPKIKPDLAKTVGHCGHGDPGHGAEVQARAQVQLVQHESSARAGHAGHLKAYGRHVDWLDLVSRNLLTNKSYGWTALGFQMDGQFQFVANRAALPILHQPTYSVCVV